MKVKLVKKKPLIALLVLWCLLPATTQAANNFPHYHLTVNLDPKRGSIHVEDELTLPVTQYDPEFTCKRYQSLSILEATAPVKEPSRKAPKELPSAFSRNFMQNHVNALTQPQMQGRGLGTEGLNKAAHYLQEQFDRIGLIPLSRYENFSQTFDAQLGNSRHTTANIIGVIPGSDPQMSGQSIVISAHYDHLGIDAKGNPYPGADDNASGIAILLELARQLKHSKLRRSLIFIAFSAEEFGLQGARYYLNHNDLKHNDEYPNKKIMANINLDTVGRLGNNKIQVFNSDSAYEWPHIFMGTSYVTGHKPQLLSQNIRTSDQIAFIEAGIPAVHIFSGAHFDMHKVTDTADKLDFNGMVKIATVVNEAIDYLGNRQAPLTSQIAR